jgi:hypothetical protein
MFFVIGNVLCGCFNTPLPITANKLSLIMTMDLPSCSENRSYQLTYLKMPRMSTSRTAALTMGNVTSEGPSPTNTTQPPDSVAWQKMHEKGLVKTHLPQQPDTYTQKEL